MCSTDIVFERCAVELIDKHFCINLLRRNHADNKLKKDIQYGNEPITVALPSRRALRVLQMNQNGIGVEEKKASFVLFIKHRLVTVHTYFVLVSI